MVDKMTALQAVLAIIGSLVVVIGSLVGTIRWVWKQSQTQTLLTAATENNTKATTALTEKFGLYVDKANGSLLDHEKRLTAVETRLKLELDVIVEALKKKGS
jgi:hypothetical protein